jgi:hypothetical protein
MARKKITITSAQVGTLIDALAGPTIHDDAAAFDDAAEAAEAARGMAKETLTGDLRDFLLDTLRHEQSRKPWHERAEADQRATISRVEEVVRFHVGRAIELLAGAGRRTITATLEQVTVKDGIKAVLTLSKHDPQRHLLVDATGAAVLIVVAGPDEFTGERAPVPVKPDQPELLARVGVVHSEPTSAAEHAGDVPFN